MDKKDISHIAALARIHLEDHELERLAKDLDQILHYVEKLQKLDVSKVEPTSHVLPLKDVYRKDEVRPSFSQREALSISQHQHQGSFKVPQVIE